MLKLYRSLLIYGWGVATQKKGSYDESANDVGARNDDGAAADQAAAEEKRDQTVHDV